jgi:hypothetical protein
MNKKTIFLLLAMCIATAWEASSQSISRFKEQLEREIVSKNGTPAHITIQEQGTAANAVASADAAQTAPRLLGYRVCIFFDNGQDARSGAMEARKIFTENFPNIPLYMVYENPYFRVTVGNCLTIEEAIILKGRLASLFPKAFPKSEELTLSDLLK